MNYYYCLSFEETTDDSCLIFRYLNGIFKTGVLSRQGEIIQSKIGTNRIELHQGMSRPGKFWEWIKNAQQETSAEPAQYRDVEIALHGPERMLFRWIIKNAYPISYHSGSEYGSAHIENVALAYRELITVYPSKHNH